MGAGVSFFKCWQRSQKRTFGLDSNARFTRRFGAADLPLHLLHPECSNPTTVLVVFSEKACGSWCFVLT